MCFTLKKYNAMTFRKAGDKMNNRVWISCNYFPSYEDKHCRSCHSDLEYGSEMCSQMDFEHEHGGRKYEVIIDACCGFEEWAVEKKDTFLKELNEYIDNPCIMLEKLNEINSNHRKGKK